jgi:hypothetical protein
MIYCPRKGLGASIEALLPLRPVVEVVNVNVSTTSSRGKRQVTVCMYSRSAIRMRLASAGL